MLASDPAFIERYESWDDGAKFIAGILKAEQRWEANLDRPAPPISDAFQRFLQGDPVYITRLLKLWESIEPVDITTRMAYPVRWRAESGELLSFAATMHVAEVWQELSWHDWIPADGATQAALRELTI